MICPICASSSHRTLMKAAYLMNRCDGCHHQFAERTPGNDHTNAVYGDHYFTGGGSGYDDDLSEVELIRAHGKRYGRVLDK